MLSTLESQEKINHTLSGNNTYPICLCPGIARFDIIFARLWKIDKKNHLDFMNYFRNLRSTIIAAGYNCEIIDSPWAQSVIDRAFNMKQCILDIMSKYNSDKVHLICHSMGGLDARRMLYYSRQDHFHQHIASVVTIGTPHHGSLIAWWALHKTFLGYSYRDALREAYKAVGRNRILLRERTLPSSYGYVPDHMFNIPFPFPYKQTPNLVSWAAKLFTSSKLSSFELKLPKIENPIYAIFAPLQRKGQLQNPHKPQTRARRFAQPGTDSSIDITETSSTLPPFTNPEWDDAASDTSIFSDSAVDQPLPATDFPSSKPSNPIHAPSTIAEFSTTINGPYTPKTQLSIPSPFLSVKATVENVAPEEEFVTEMDLLREYYLGVRQEPSFTVLGVDINGIIDLMPSQCEEFNTLAKPFEASCGVFFYAIAGCREYEAQFPVLRAMHGVHVHMERFDLLDQAPSLELSETTKLRQKKAQLEKEEMDRAIQNEAEGKGVKLRLPDVVHVLFDADEAQEELAKRQEDQINTKDEHDQFIRTRTPKAKGVAKPVEDDASFVWEPLDQKEPDSSHEPVHIPTAIQSSKTALSPIPSTTDSIPELAKSPIPAVAGPTPELSKSAFSMYFENPPTVSSTTSETTNPSTTPSSDPAAVPNIPQSTSIPAEIGKVTPRTNAIKPRTHTRAKKEKHQKKPTPPPSQSTVSFLQKLTQYSPEEWEHFSFNDGLVTLKSQAWCEEFFSGIVWDADHLHEIGWGTLDARACARGSIAQQEQSMKEKWLSICAKLARQFPLTEEFSAG
ncbi:putative triacylglycerol lipase [Blattamonas nauphoetae]|uniref:GPI inositol-deacylase n=1 Tax=Blattamonas nauphoetae TaxID=2049346 RepID=A0ABQ9XQ77_9EUKA|nr:putative triacylglycerol lipase [Blattamonas nauphoetae]